MFCSRSPIVSADEHVVSFLDRASIPRVSTSLVPQYEEDRYYKDCFYLQRHVFLWLLVMKTVFSIEGSILRVWPIFGGRLSLQRLSKNSTQILALCFCLCSTVSSPWCACGSPFLELFFFAFLRGYLVSDLDRICKTSTRLAVDNKLRLRL
jgi:hypothetical protein